MAYVSSYGTHTSLGLRVLLIAVAVVASIIGFAVRVRRMRGYTGVSPWKKLLLWETSPWSLSGRMVRRSADAEQAEADRLAVFAQQQIALAQQGAADPAARYGLASLPAPPGGPAMSNPFGTPAAPTDGFPPAGPAFPPPRPTATAPTADDVLPHP